MEITIKKVSNGYMVQASDGTLYVIEENLNLSGVEMEIDSYRRVLQKVMDRIKQHSIKTYTVSIK